MSQVSLIDFSPMASNPSGLGKHGYTAMISENGNFGDFFWDSDDMKRKMCGPGDSWSTSNNAGSVEDGDPEDKKRRQAEVAAAAAAAARETPGSLQEASQSKLTAEN